LDVRDRILTASWDVPGLHRLAVARDQGVYRDLGDLLRLEPGEITAVVADSGLRGRGGAGFPTGVKWRFVPPREKCGNRPVYLLCNADESEPGTFKDRFILWLDPHRLIEGMILSARAISSHAAYVYFRGEFAFLARRFEEALGEAHQAGLLGQDILGSGFDLEIHTHLGAGAYICGEETGLIQSLEGATGQPRNKPPFPAVSGVWGCPTVVNNVETLAVVPWIVRNGAQAFRRFGTEKSPGTKLFSVSGPVVRPGVYEEPLGIPFKDLLEGSCGGLRPGRKLKALIPGGSSVPVLTAEEALSTRMDFESLADLGSFLGSGGVIVLDDTTDMVAALRNIARFYAHESCGQCTPCREGCGWMYRILCRIEEGSGNAEDLDTLASLAENIAGRTICALGDAAAWPVMSFLQKFRSEFEDRLSAVA
jgi:NADH-quinone oxidoreductase subunit F